MTVKFNNGGDGLRAIASIPQWEDQLERGEISVEGYTAQDVIYAVEKQLMEDENG